MNKARLLKLADLLEADAANPTGIKFDLSIVATKAPKDHEIDEDGDWTYRIDRHAFLSEDEVKLDCGTAACAVGLACISGAFAKDGLGYVIDYRGMGLQPTYNEERGWGVERDFFDLSEEESDFLFMKSAYPKRMAQGAVGERYVAQRIRNFVAGTSKPER